MSELSDRDLETQLNRRRSATPLNHGQRTDLIGSIHARTAMVGRESGWSRWRWLAGAAVATALVVVVTIALPRVVSGPSASPSPTSAAPKSLVMSVDEFAAAAGDPEWIERVVLARVTLDTRTIIERFIRPCTWTSVCPIAVVAGVEPELLVVANPQASDNSQAGPQSIPSGEAVMAFRVREHDVEYLGEASVSPGDTAWTIGALPPSADARLYPIDGWLVGGPFLECPSPAGTMPPDSWAGPLGCGDPAWLTPLPYQPTRITGRDAETISLDVQPPGDGLRVQNRAYESFAPDAKRDGHGVADPRRSVYLARAIACADAASCALPTWEIVGRLEQPITTVEPTQPPAIGDEFRVLSEAELVLLAADLRATGRIVVSDAAIYATLIPSPLEPSDFPFIGVVGQDRNTYVVGRTGWNSSDPYRAFRVLGGQLEYLGAVNLAADSVAWSVPDLVAAAPVDPSAELYPVTGWLLQTTPAPCAAPPDMSSPQDYWCGGSWITSEPTATTDESTVQLTLPQALHVQWDAYGRFADDPQIGAGGGEPRQGTYLVRPAGCPPNVTGDCPVWEMAGRLYPPLTSSSTPTATPEPTPSTPTSGVVFDARGVPIAIDGQRVFEGPEIATQIAEATDDTTFLIVGGFVSYGWPDCPPMLGVPLLCGPGGGFLSAKDGNAYQVAVVFEGPQPAPHGSLVVLAVHVHDSSASDCPDEYRPQCEQAVVFEDVAWQPLGPTPTIPGSSSAPTASPWPALSQPLASPTLTPPTGLETSIFVERPGIRFSVVFDRNPMPAGEPTGAVATVTNTDSTDMYWLHDGCASGIGVSGRIANAYPPGVAQQGVAAAFKDRIFGVDGGTMRLAFVNPTGPATCGDIGITDSVAAGELIVRRLVWDGSAWGRGGAPPTGSVDMEVITDLFWHGDPNPDRAAATYQLSQAFTGFAWIAGVANSPITKVQAVDAALAVPDFGAYLETVDLQRDDTPFAWYLAVDQAWFVGIATGNSRLHYVVIDSVSGANRGIVDRPWDPARDEF